MFFSTYSILAFSICCVLVCAILPQRSRRWFLLLASAGFYGWCDIHFLGLLALEILFSWFVGKKISEKRICGQSGKKELCIGILGIILVLFAFKYYGFFAEVFQISLKGIVLPLGISYYSFKAISYLADVFTGKIQEEKSLVNYGLYVSFFPHLLSGPITRATEMCPQFMTMARPSPTLVEQGALLILSGLFKKVVIADRLNFYVNVIFDNPSIYPSIACILAAILFTVQLYCDFAGYSEIAIGITNLFGFRCSPNFTRPYFSHDIRDFWRRWHISLSSWLRDYIYIPLGGSRVTAVRHVRNVLCTFVACGAWHGSALHYLFWGVYHGILNVLTPRIECPQASRVKRCLGCLFTLFAVVIGWIFFKAKSMDAAVGYIVHSVRDFAISSDVVSRSILPFTFSNACLAYFLVSILMVLILFVQELLEERGRCYPFTFATIQMFCIILFGFVGESPFLYANF